MKLLKKILIVCGAVVVLSIILVGVIASRPETQKDKQWNETVRKYNDDKKQDEQTDRSDTKKDKKPPQIIVNNPYNNGYFWWKTYNNKDDDEIQGSVKCTATAIGDLSWKVYDDSGTIVDDYTGYPVFIHKGETKKISLFSHKVDIWKASRIEITVTSEN